MEENLDKLINVINRTTFSECFINEKRYIINSPNISSNLIMYELNQFQNELNNHILKKQTQDFWGLKNIILLLETYFSDEYMELIGYITNMVVLTRNFRGTVIEFYGWFLEDIRNDKIIDLMFDHAKPYITKIQMILFESIYNEFRSVNKRLFDKVFFNTKACLKYFVEYHKDEFESIITIKCKKLLDEHKLLVYKDLMDELGINLFSSKAIKSFVNNIISNENKLHITQIENNNIKQIYNKEKKFCYNYLLNNKVYIHTFNFTKVKSDEIIKELKAYLCYKETQKKDISYFKNLIYLQDVISYAENKFSVKSIFDITEIVLDSIYEFFTVQFESSKNKKKMSYYKIKTIFYFISEIFILEQKAEGSVQYKNIIATLKNYNHIKGAILDQNIKYYPEKIEKDLELCSSVEERIKYWNSVGKYINTSHRNRLTEIRMADVINTLWLEIRNGVITNKCRELCEFNILLNIIVKYFYSEFIDIIDVQIENKKIWKYTFNYTKEICNEVFQFNFIDQDYIRIRSIIKNQIDKSINSRIDKLIEYHLKNGLFFTEYKKQIDMIILMRKCISIFVVEFESYIRKLIKKKSDEGEFLNKSQIIELIFGKIQSGEESYSIISKIIEKVRLEVYDDPIRIKIIKNSNICMNPQLYNELTFCINNKKNLVNYFYKICNFINLYEEKHHINSFSDITVDDLDNVFDTIINKTELISLKKKDIKDIIISLKSIHKIQNCKELTDYYYINGQIYTSRGIELPDNIDDLRILLKGKKDNFIWRYIIKDIYSSVKIAYRSDEVFADDLKMIITDLNNGFIKNSTICRMNIKCVNYIVSKYYCKKYKKIVFSFLEKQENTNISIDTIFRAIYESNYNFNNSKSLSKINKEARINFKYIFCRNLILQIISGNITFKDACLKMDWYALLEVFYDEYYNDLKEYLTYLASDFTKRKQIITKSEFLRIMIGNTKKLSFKVSKIINNIVIQERKNQIKLINNWNKEEILSNKDTVKIYFKEGNNVLSKKIHFKNIKKELIRSEIRQYVRYRCRKYLFKDSTQYHQLFLSINYLCDKFPDIQCVADINEIHVNVILDYFFSSKQNFQIGTIRKYISVYKGLVNFLIESDNIFSKKPEQNYFEVSFRNTRNMEKRTEVIPEEVIEQLDSYSHELTEHMEIKYRIFRNTGLRPGEVMNLERGCIKESEYEDLYSLSTRQTKISHRLRKKRMVETRDIFIPSSVAKDILDIEEKSRVLSEQYEISSIFLYPSKNGWAVKSGTVRGFNHAINRLIIRHNIVDKQGNLWQFSSRQFRKTIVNMLMEMGVTGMQLSYALGHLSERTVKDYYEDYCKLKLAEMNTKFFQNKFSILIKPEQLDRFNGEERKVLYTNFIMGIRKVDFGYCLKQLNQTNCNREKCNWNCANCHKLATGPQYLQDWIELYDSNLYELEKLEKYYITNNIYNYKDFKEYQNLKHFVDNYNNIIEQIKGGII